MLKTIYVFACCVLLSIPLTAQTTWSAEGSGLSVWVGASISTFNPDYGCQHNSIFSCWDGQLLGISPYVHTNGFVLNRIGAAGQARFLHWRGPGKLTESSYMAGPRVNLFQKKKFVFSGQFLAGSAHLDVSQGAGSGSYFAFAPGGAVDYRLARRVLARVDYEYQFWPGFNGGQSGASHGLTPNGFSVGLSYSVLP